MGPSRWYVWLTLLLPLPKDILRLRGDFTGISVRFVGEAMTVSCRVAEIRTPRVGEVNMKPLIPFGGGVLSLVLIALADDIFRCLVISIKMVCLSE